MNINSYKEKFRENNLDESLVDYYYNYLEKNNQLDKLDEGIEKLLLGKPIQYIIGNVDFYGNIIRVNEDVLIPRFETEGLIEKTLKYLNKTKCLDIVDLGTGSGCIAITLKKLLNCNIDAVDISEKALKIAKENARLNKSNINFYLGNMLEPLEKKYDVIISNPPYISENEKIMSIVKDNEPKQALYAPNEGLYYYEEILRNCLNYVKDKYLIAFEIGWWQAEEIKKIINKYLKNVDIIIEKDLAGKNRYIFIKNC